MLNMNDFAAEVAKREGKKKQQDIAQIKETIKIVVQLLGEQTDREAIQILNRYRPAASRTRLPRIS